MNRTIFDEAPTGYHFVFSRWITRNGKRIYHPKGGFFRFLIKDF